MWTRISCLIVVLGLGGMLLRCTPSVVQLDPNWPSSQSSTDGGTQVTTDGGTQTTTPPQNCIPAPTAFLKQTSAFSDKRAILLIGQQPDLKHRMIHASAPKNWRIIPDITVADEQGQFAFWVNRQATTATNHDKITVWLDTMWCYDYQPVITERENQKKVQSVSAKACQPGQDDSLTLDVLGKLSENAVGFSSRPDLVAVTSVRLEDKLGTSTLRIQYRCLKTGDALLMIGGGDLDAQIVSVSVKD